MFFHVYYSLETNLILMANRGLLLKPEWAAAFVEGKKCLEIRSQNVRCLKQGDLVYILASGQGTNPRGVHVVQIVGSMEFVGTQQITDQAMFESLRSKHQVEYAAFCALVRGTSKKDKERGQTKHKFSPCFGWEFTNIKKLETSKWIAWRNDSRHMGFCCGHPGVFEFFLPHFFGHRLFASFHVFFISKVFSSQRLVEFFVFAT